MLAKKGQIKQRAMRQLLSGRIRLAGFTESWFEETIGQFATCVAGGTPSTLISDYWGGSIRWMSSGELHAKRVRDVHGRITERGLANSNAQMLPPKSVLVGLAGQGRTRGTVAMNMVPLTTNQSIAAIL